MLRDLSRAWRQWRFLTPWLGLVLSAFILTAIRTQAQIAPAQRDVRDAGPARHVGSQACATCHASQSAAWAGSHHAHAMDHARPSSMRGDFADRTVEEAGRRARFFPRWRGLSRQHRGGGWPPGRLHDLSQPRLGAAAAYLVTFPDGRLQVLPWAWDTRSAAEGGQRWFLVSGAEAIATSDSRTGPGCSRTGTICAPSATRPICARATMRRRIGSRRAGPSSPSAARPATDPPAVMFHGRVAARARPIRSRASLRSRQPVRRATGHRRRPRHAGRHDGRPAGDSVETCAAVIRAGGRSPWTGGRGAR